MITSIPFSGFYNSIHDSELDFYLQSTLSDLHGNTNDRLLNEVRDSINWSECFTLYSQEYTEVFSEKFGIELKFESLRSPKYYNFETDRIFCHISDNEIARIFSCIKLDTLKRLIREKFTSCDGFISFYPNVMEEWDSDPTTWDHNQLGTLIEAYIVDHDEYCEEYELYLCESVSEKSYRIIDPCMSEKGVRALNIHDYLMRREERV